MSMMNAPASQNSSVGMMEVMDSTQLTMDHAGDRLPWLVARGADRVQGRGLTSNSSHPIAKAANP